MTSETVGFIGLDNMGAGMARNLLKSGAPLYVFDINANAVNSLVEAGAIACKSSAQVASQCSLVFICVPFTPEARAVMFGKYSITSANKKSLTVVDTTTLDRTDAFAIAPATVKSSRN